jgi:hypothetical protein
MIPVVTINRSGVRDNNKKMSILIVVVQYHVFLLQPDIGDVGRRVVVANTHLKAEKTRAGELVRRAEISVVLDRLQQFASKHDTPSVIFCGLLV